MNESKIKINGVYCLKENQTGLFILSKDNGNGTGSFIDHLGDKKDLPYDALEEVREFTDAYPDEWRKS